MAWYHSLRKIRRVRVQEKSRGDVTMYLRGYHPDGPSNVSVTLDREQAKDVVDALSEYLDGGLDDDIIHWWDRYD